MISGRVVASGEGTVTIENGAGRFEARCEGRNPAVGAEAAFVVQADLIAAEPAGTADEAATGTSVTGRLETEDFKGAVVTLYVSLQDGSQLFVQKQQHDIDRLDLSRGASLRLSWSVDDTVLLPD